MSTHSTSSFKNKRILITGGTGFIGRALIARLVDFSAEVFCLTNKSLLDKEHFPSVRQASSLNEFKDKNFDYVVNLAGAPIADKKWSAARKQELEKSRIDTTQELFDFVSALPEAPQALVSASAVGIYGDSGNESVDENYDTESQTELNSANRSKGSTGFSAELCRKWEATAKQFEQVCPVAIARFAVVLGREGGAWPKMTFSTRFGFSTYFGSGKQHFPWIHIDDAVTAILFLLLLKSEHSSEKDQQSDARLEVFNLVAPQHISSRTFAEEVVKNTHALFSLSILEFFVDLLFGQMGRELFLYNQKILPNRLERYGFQFKYPSLKEAMIALQNQQVENNNNLFSQS